VIVPYYNAYKSSKPVPNLPGLLIFIVNLRVEELPVLIQFFLFFRLYDGVSGVKYNTYIYTA